MSNNSENETSYKIAFDDLILSTRLERIEARFEEKINCLRRQIDDDAKSTADHCSSRFKNIGDRIDKVHLSLDRRIRDAKYNVALSVAVTAVILSLVVMFT